MTVAAAEPVTVRSVFRQVMRSLTRKQQNPAGVMAALFLPADVAGELALPGGLAPGDLHLTLRIFAPDAAALEQHEIDRIAADVEQVARRTPALSGRVSGVGVFNGDQAGGDDVVYATLDLPGLMSLWQDVRWCGPMPDDREGDGPGGRPHEFTPHVTLAYGQREVPDIPTTPIRFDRLTLAIGGERREFLFAGVAVAKAE
ncbi:MAG TPA: 2'-5' RNA ligase family protein, partial [Planctomycetaceae bacterium]